MGKKRNVSDARLNVMIRDLKLMKAQLLPDDPNAGDEEMKGFDDFQKGKARLNAHLHALAESIRDLNDERKKLGGARSVRIISLQNENHKDLVKAKDMCLKLRGLVDRQVKKKKLPAEELEEREKFVALLSKEIRRLEELNSRVQAASGGGSGGDATSQAIDRNRRKAAERAERRKKQRERRRQQAGAGGGTGAAGDVDDMDDELESRPMSRQEQEFMQEVAEKDQQIDQMLDTVMEGLVELKEIATDINTQLDVQNEMLGEIDTKMDGTIVEYKDANRRLKDLIQKETGGATAWCPFIILAVILMGVIGYIINIA